MAPTRDETDAQETIDRQDGLRARYRDHPEEAWITDRGRTTSMQPDDPVHMRGVPGSQDYGTEWPLGLHAAVGGLHDAPNPGDLLCLALAACMDSVIRMLAARHGLALAHLEVDVTADVDVRGTLQVSRDVPVGFQAMRCHIRVEPEPGAPPALVRRLLAAAERSCVNLATLRNGVPVETSCQVV
jgi:uncharacterized OsmC-like protein